MDLSARFILLLLTTILLVSVRGDDNSFSTLVIEDATTTTTAVASSSSSSASSLTETSTEQTEVPSIVINNQNVTNYTSVMTETTTLPSALNVSENQLKVSTFESNLITTSASTVQQDIVTETPVTEITSSSHVDHHHLITQQQSDEDTINGESTISFGIRSFTVEVSKNEKLLTTAVPRKENIQKTTTTTTTATTLDEATKQTQSSQMSSSASLSDEMTTTTAPTYVNAESSSTTITTNSKEATVAEATTENAIESHSPSLNVLKSNLNILFNDGDDSDDNHESNSHENEISNEIQIDKRLENGLYRIKIGEITTDEFSNGMNFNEPDDKLHHEQSATKVKVNIDDFFPSKIEDFSPIIEISNEKMLKQKDLLHNEQVRPEFSLSEEVNVGGGGEIVSGTKTGTRINTSNIATTNIEIELIDDMTAVGNSGQRDKGMEIDEIITQVEEIVTEVAPEATKINIDNTFIPRRTKKFDPSAKSNTQGPTRIHDFGMTKFNQHKENLTQNQVNGKPEFSTTKFYNSKELYNEILHKSPKSASTTMPQLSPHSSMTPAKATIKPITNMIREKLLNTNKIPIDASHIVSTAAAAATLEPITMTATTQSIATTTEQEEETTVRPFTMPTSHPRVLSRLEEKLNSLDCDIQNLSADSTVWRGNETHELNLPITVSTPPKYFIILFC